MKSLNVFNQQNQDSLMFFESELFKKVQIEALYPDSKVFADAIPKVSYGEILAQYQLYIKNQSSVNLKAFIDEYFTIPQYEDVSVNGDKVCVDEHIEILWQSLQKPADDEISGSLLPLKSAYIVPGGRFREIYYWDSYFTALGLLESNHHALVESILNSSLKT